MFKAERARRAAGIDFLAVYHSHPTSPPIPSKTDIADNHWPNAMTIIVSLTTEPPNVAGWWLLPDGYEAALIEINDADAT